MRVDTLVLPGDRRIVRINVAEPGDFPASSCGASSTSTSPTRYLNATRSPYRYSPSYRAIAFGSGPNGFGRGSLNFAGSPKAHPGVCNGVSNSMFPAGDGGTDPFSVVRCVLRRSRKPPVQGPTYRSKSVSKATPPTTSPA